jgi:acetolactate synthase-1/2/3 large subunit
MVRFQAMTSQVTKKSDATTVSVAEYFASFLTHKKVPAVFELSGGMIAFLTDAISQEGSVPIINVRHEQAAGFAAEGASRSSRIPSVALATSGPGATNLVTAVGSAYFDSTPVLFITGQVHQSELRKDINQRQNGFQELNIVEMVKGITKFAIQVRNPDEFKSALQKAWSIATNDRPGPVLIDIPIDVQQMKLEPFSVVALEESGKVPNLTAQSDFEELHEWLNNSKNPLVLVGGGVRLAGCIEEFRQTIKLLQIPVVHSLMAVDALPSNSPYRVGMIGSYGNRWANKALAASDTILVLGSRLDVRQTGSSVEEFMAGKRIIRVDIDQFELDGRVNANLDLKMNINSFFELLDVTRIQIDSRDFMKSISLWKAEYPAENEQDEDFELNPNFVVSRIGEFFKDAKGFLVDVGQHQMWAAQSLSLLEDQRFITSGGMGAMGFSIPAAIGCAAGNGGKWVAIAGDGCAQLSLPELQTLKQYNLAVAVCIINNEQLGMVAQFQEENMESRYIATRDGYSNPDFMAIAKAFGIPSFRVRNKLDLLGLQEMINTWVSGPILIEIEISQKAKALPKLKRDSGLSDL